MHSLTIEDSIQFYKFEAYFVSRAFQTQDIQLSGRIANALIFNQDIAIEISLKFEHSLEISHFFI
jgi:hypothetical protein